MNKAELVIQLLKIAIGIAFTSPNAVTRSGSQNTWRAITAPWSARSDDAPLRTRSRWGLTVITAGDRFGASLPRRAASASWKSPVDTPRR